MMRNIQPRSRTKTGSRRHRLAGLATTLLFLALPATAGENWTTHSEPRFDLEISYPDSYLFSQDPALLEGARSASADELNQHQAGQLEFVFFVFLHEPGSVAFNPNLNLSVEQLPEALAGLSEQGYLEASLATMARTGVQRLGQGEVPGVVIDGRTFYRLDSTIHAYGKEIQTRSYIHYDPATRRGYNLTLADLAADVERHFPLLEAVVETLRLEDPAIESTPTPASEHPTASEDTTDVQ